jgi:WD40 repeat protein
MQVLLIFIISSVSYVPSEKVLITASKDANIRVWTMEGEYVGVFGQENPWILNDISTYAPQPEDLRIEAQIEKKREEMILTQKEDLQRTVIETWKGLVASNLSPEVEEDGKKIVIHDR